MIVFILYGSRFDQAFVDPPRPCFFFFFNDTATTEIYTLSLHDALPISRWQGAGVVGPARDLVTPRVGHEDLVARSEEHTSELQSPCNLVCRLLLEKKKTQPHPLVHLRPHAALLDALPRPARQALHPARV